MALLTCAEPPYSNWNVESQAAESGCAKIDILDFDHRIFPGYEHQTTDPDAKIFDSMYCKTFVFVPAAGFQRAPASRWPSKSAAAAGAGAAGAGARVAADSLSSAADARVESKRAALESKASDPGDDADSAGDSAADDSDDGGLAAASASRSAAESQEPGHSFWAAVAVGFINCFGRSAHRTARVRCSFPACRCVSTARARSWSSRKPPQIWYATLLSSWLLL
jgi:hypothetical protein